MINFRYHIISVSAVFFALAVGIALGAGVLSGSMKGGFGSDSQSAASEASSADSQKVDTFRAGYTKRLAPSLLGSRLKGRSVAVFAVTGAKSETVKGVVADIKQAGGRVTTQVRLTDKLVDPADRQFAQGVASQALDGVENVDTADKSSYELVGSALSRAFVAAKGAKVDEGASTIISAYSESGLVSVDHKPKRRADLAVLVVGETDSNTHEGQGELVGLLATSLDKHCAGTLVAGPPSSAHGEGAVAAVREGEAANAVSTVDVVGLPAGRVVSVLALQREARGKAGHFGAINAENGAMPGVGG